jgi:hypothetical protein
MKEKFVLFEGDNESFIVTRSAPFAYARVLLFRDDMGWIAYTNLPANQAYQPVVQVFPYKIGVQFMRSLSGKLPVDYLQSGKIKTVAQQMADWYLEEVIKLNPEKFKKYLF